LLDVIFQRLRVFATLGIILFLVRLTLELRLRIFPTRLRVIRPLLFSIPFFLKF